MNDGRSRARVFESNCEMSVCTACGALESVSPGLSSGRESGAPAAGRLARELWSTGRSGNGSGRVPAMPPRWNSYWLEKGVRAMLRAAGVPVTAVGIGKDSVRVELPRAKLEKALSKA